jgi:predicted enzyme related to lactoylglutathione lyase
MVKQLTSLTIMVRNQDEALRWYVEKLGFEKRDDTRTETSRWLTIGVPGQKHPTIALIEPTTKQHGAVAAKAMESQIGKNPTWVLQVEDCRKLVYKLLKEGVKVVSEPKNEPWGVHSLIEDLYGNLFDINQPWK